MKTLLLISHSSSLTGGGEDDFQKLLVFLSGKYNIYTIFPKGERAEVYKKYSNKYIEINSTIFPFTKFSIKSYLGFFVRNIKKIFKIYSFVKNNKDIDICYLNSSVCFMEAIPIVLLKIPYVLSAKEKINPEIISKIIFLFYKKTAAKILTISKFLQNEIINQTKRKDIEVIYSTIDEEYFEKVITSKKNGKEAKKDNTFKILNIGSIFPMKGQHILVEALSKMKNEKISVEFVGNIINRDYFSKIFNIVKNNSITGNVKYLGELNKYDLIYKILDSDCIVITSKEEGQSLVILESLFLKKPVITTKVGIATEIIENNVNGIVYDFGNIVGLSESIKKLKNDKELYDKISKNCKETYSKNFNSVLTMLNYDYVFKKLLDN